MKKEGSKRNQKPPKTRLKPRECLLELNFNSQDPRPQGKSRPALRPHPLQPFESLPLDLHLSILSFLPASDLLLQIQLLSRSWHHLANAPVLWRWLEAKGLPLKWRVKLLKSLVERRSKGKVYLGVLRSSQVAVTVRRVFLDVTNAGFDDGIPTSLLREISYLKELEHSNITRLLAVEVTGRTLQICSEQSEFNLIEYMGRFGKDDVYQMPQQDIQSIMRQLLTALEFLHTAGIMHRNLKPDNIMMDRQGGLKVADFTMSRFCHTPRGMYTPEDPKERDRSGREARRLWYRAPELLFRKEMYSFEVDMWTVGCILAELCIGQPIFGGENEIEQLFKIFRFTGVPHDVFPLQSASFPHWERISFAAVLLEKTSAECQRLMNALVPARESAYKALLQIGAAVGPEGLDLLERCLELDPAKRITVQEALSHPFVSCERSQLSPLLRRLHSLEATNVCTGNYFPLQNNITPTMRSILVDWLIDVSVHFEVTDQTLHLAVGLIDRVLGLLTIDRSRLQLVGVTCMKIADVFNERSKEYYRQENSIEYSYITADEYSPTEVVEMEKRVLTLLDFKTVTPTILSYLGPFTELLELDEDTAGVALYLADLLLLSEESLKFPPSLLASAVLYIACCYSGRFPAQSTKNPLAPHSETEFAAASKHVRELWMEVRSNPNFSRYESINHKFSSLTPSSLWPPTVHSQPWTFNKCIV